MEVLFSDEACETRKTLMPLSANVRKMRWFTPMTPTMPRPCTVMRLVSLMDEMPLIALLWGSFCAQMMVPFASGLKVFLMRMGMFLWHTG